MLGKYQLYIGLSGCTHLPGVCIYYHALLNEIIAGCNTAFCTLNLYNTDSARTNLIDVFQITQGWYRFTNGFGSIKDCRTFFYGYITSINL